MHAFMLYIACILKGGEHADIAGKRFAGRCLCAA